MPLAFQERAVSTGGGTPDEPARSRTARGSCVGHRIGIEARLWVDRHASTTACGTG